MVQRKTKQDRLFLKGTERLLERWISHSAHQERVQAMISTRTKAEARTNKERARKVLILNLDVSASETPCEEGHGHSWESDDGYSSFTHDSSCSNTAWYGTGHTAWMASVPLNLAHHPTRVVLDLGCSRSIGSKAAIRRFQKYALYHCITTEFCPCNMSFVFANSETETCWGSCIILCPTTPPCSSRVDVLETGNVIILSLPFLDEKFGYDY